MIYVKFMSGEDLADVSVGHMYALETAEGVRFTCEDGVPVALLRKADQTVCSVRVTGNVYVMNAQGDTISTFTA